VLRIEQFSDLRKNADDQQIVSLSLLVDRAISTLSNARSAAEVLEARDLASIAYDASKKAARLAEAKGAHDGLVAAAHRAQADALEIEAQAKRRLADEYDAAQKRGEIAHAGGERSGRERSAPAPTAADLGLSRKQVYEARNSVMRKPQNRASCVAPSMKPSTPAKSRQRPRSTAQSRR
jgi:hypothetical protein